MSKKKSSKKAPASLSVSPLRAMLARGAFRAPAPVSQADMNRLALEALGGVVMGPSKKKRPTLTAAEKAARAKVLEKFRASAARAARLPGKKRTTKKKTAKRAAAPRATAPRAAAPRAAARRSSKRAPTVTANQVIAKATRTALTRWLCEGARRSGCGAGGSRVVTGSGSFKRIRPLRFMTAG